MVQDKTTLKDLGIFPSQGSEDGGLFALLDHTTTQWGKEQLRNFIQRPPATYDELMATQQVIHFLGIHRAAWPKMILNGTLVVLDKYFDTADTDSRPPAGPALLLSSLLRKMLLRKDQALQQFNLLQLSDFLTGCSILADLDKLDHCPTLLLRHCDMIRRELAHRLTDKVLALPQKADYAAIAQLHYYVRREMKPMVHRLISLFAMLDAWQSMAIATNTHQWQFPDILPPGQVELHIEGLRHPLLTAAVGYDLELNPDSHFLVLTGANMSGKTTFLRATGIAVMLAHLGMGVPAQKMTVGFMGGIITNMHVEDNLLKGESYFLAEVLRMKHTAQRLKEGATQLVLMDELFKGTNVHDACECTRAVIEALSKCRNHIILLSTHLYEVVRQLKLTGGISFAYFVIDTDQEGNFNFTYRLQPGISDDRIGYRILRKEGVIDLLDKLATK